MPIWGWRMTRAAGDGAQRPGDFNVQVTDFNAAGTASGMDIQRVGFTQDRAEAEGDLC